jgi:hypothetical protein
VRVGAAFFEINEEGLEEVFYHSVNLGIFSYF